MNYFNYSDKDFKATLLTLHNDSKGKYPHNKWRQRKFPKRCQQWNFPEWLTTKMETTEEVSKLEGRLVRNYLKTKRKKKVKLKTQKRFIICLTGVPEEGKYRDRKHLKK